jgi:hypothetical protein
MGVQACRVKSKTGARRTPHHSFADYANDKTQQTIVDSLTIV